MVSAHLSQAADILQASRKDGGVSDNLPETCRPQSREEGYQIQAIIEADDPRIGWKIAATSIAGQQHIGIDGPIAGRLTETMVFAEDDIVPFGSNGWRLQKQNLCSSLPPFLPRASAYRRMR